MSLVLLLSIYAAVIATLTFLWRLYEFYDNKRGKFKITYEFYSNFLIGGDMFGTVCVFTIINLSSKRRIIQSIGYSLNDSDDTIYSPIERFNMRPKHLEFGESLSYDIYYTDFNNLIEETQATKLKLVVRDSTEKIYTTKWIKIKRFKKSSGYITEMPKRNEEIGNKMYQKMDAS